MIEVYCKSPHTLPTKLPSRCHQEQITGKTRSRRSHIICVSCRRSTLSPTPIILRRNLLDKKNGLNGKKNNFLGPYINSLEVKLEKESVPFIDHSSNSSLPSEWREETHLIIRRISCLQVKWENEIVLIAHFTLSPLFLQIIKRSPFHEKKIQMIIKRISRILYIKIWKCEKR